VKNSGDKKASGFSQPEGATNAVSIPLRKLPREEYYVQDNELTDIYAPIIGPFAAMIYGVLCRKSYGSPVVEHSVRELASTTGMSPTAVARSIELLVTVGLIERVVASGNRKSVCRLFDVKALALSQGAKRERKSAHFELPASIVDGLRTQVRSVRRRQQGKAKTEAISSGKRNVEIATRTGFHSLFSVSQRDATVSELVRQRPSRETQIGIHLIQEERRKEKSLSPTPSHERELQSKKTTSDEDGSGVELQFARVVFTAVIDEMANHLLDTSRPPVPHLANGAADWNEFAFGSPVVVAASRREGELHLTLSAPDPEAVRSGLQKYRLTWEASLRKWFGPGTHWQVVQASE
jgi:hypothetical protein